MNIISNIYDLYEDYKLLCKKYKEQILLLDKENNWLQHFLKLQLIKYGK